MKTSVLTTHWQQLPEKIVRELQAEKLRHYLRTTVLPFSSHYRGAVPRKQSRLPTLSARWTICNGSRSRPRPTCSTRRNNPQKDPRFHPRAGPSTTRPPAFNDSAGAAARTRRSAPARFEREFRPVFMTCTTGRSAESIAFTYSNHDLANLALAGKRIFEICKAEPDFRLLNTFPYAPHLAFWLAHYGGMEFTNFVLSSGGGKVLGTDGQLRFMRQLQPHVIMGMPTFLYHVLRQAVEEGRAMPQSAPDCFGRRKSRARHAPQTRAARARTGRRIR